MAGYLGVTDDMSLTLAGVSVVAKDFLRRDEGARDGVLPAYSGTGARVHSWMSPFYNQESKTVSTVRGLIASALYAEADVHIVCIGDSKTIGSGPNRGKTYLDSYPSVLGRMLGAVEGLIPAFWGGNQYDDRWTSTGMRATSIAGTMGIVPIDGNAGPYTVTFTSGFNHAGGTFWVTAAKGATIKVSVDGGAQQTITVPAGAGFRPVTPTVNGTSAHTYQLTTPDSTHLTAFAPAYVGPRLKVSRVAWGGSKAVEWVPGYRENRDGHWDSLLTTDPDVIMVGLGTNGTYDSLLPVYAAAVGLGAQVVAISPGGLGGEGGLQPLTNYYPMYDLLWDAADRYDLPLIDFQSIIGDWPTGTAAGLLADVVHESRTGYAYEAAAVAKLLAPPSPR